MMDRVITPYEHDGGHGEIVQSTMETYVHMYNVFLEWAQDMEGSYLYNEDEGTREGIFGLFISRYV